MAVAQRTNSVLEFAPRARPVSRPLSHPATPPVQAPSRRHIRVREPQIGLLVQRAMLALIPAACIVTVIFGQMRLLEAYMQRSHFNSEVNQELSKQHVLRSALLNSVRPEQIDKYALDNGMEMKVDAPLFVGAHQKGQ